MIFAMAAVLCLGIFAQPKGMPPRSTYELVDEVRKELNLDRSQFEKVYSAYEKYNKTVFGEVDKKDGMPAPPPGGMPGDPQGNRPGNGGGHDFGSGRPGGHPEFNGQRPGNGAPYKKAPEPVDFKKMEKTRVKAEEKLEKTMKKLFKKDAAAYSRWQSLRSRQLKQMMPTPPAGAPK